jgi:osmoprotectant transport system permease protein
MRSSCHHQPRSFNGTWALPVCVLFFICQAATAQGVQETPQVRIGSKAFTESVVLGEALAALARDAGAEALHRQQLGGTQVVWQALVRGDIDIYPEYTGTISEEILAGQFVQGDEAVRAVLAERGIRMGGPLGFNNTYAIGMREEVAERLGIRSISDLRDHPELRFGFSNEFMDRADGWPSVRERYNLPQRDVRGMDHDLAYRALEADSIQITDLYSTDAEIQYYSLRVLEDDLGHFPEYHAVLLWRADLEQRAPEALAAMRLLEGRISEEEMVALNARVKIEGQAEGAVAAEFVARQMEIETLFVGESRWERIWLRTREHLLLVAVPLSAAIVIGMVLGIAGARRPVAGQAILIVVGIIFTIPSLALLVFMIPLLGIGTVPAVVALFLYNLLPIVRNTHAGLVNIPAPLRESAVALGLTPGARLWAVELPLAGPAILAGIKTAAIVNIGTATLGALIGAGGYGQPVLTGLRLNNMGLILEGAVPAALLAILALGLFEVIERIVVPRGLRLKAQAI